MILFCSWKVCIFGGATILQFKSFHEQKYIIVNEIRFYFLYVFITDLPFTLVLGGGIRISRNFVHRHEMRNFAKFRAPLHMVKCEYLGIHMVNIISRNFVRRHEMRNFAKFRAPLYGNPPPRSLPMTISRGDPEHVVDAENSL